MIILDTNVISALMTPDKNSQVVAWLDRQTASDVWITAITFLEGRFGILRLSNGRRRAELAMRFDLLVFSELDGRILAFDKDAAERTAAVSVLRRNLNRDAAYHDMQIAGIALTCNAVLATRNLRDFRGLGLSVVNPWEA